MNLLKFQKTKTASFDILGDRLKVIDFLKKGGRFHAFAEIRRQLGIPTRRLRDILNTRCEGYVARQGDRYGFFRTEKKVVAPISSPVTEPKSELRSKSGSKQSEKRKLEDLEKLREEAYTEIKKLRPNITDERAWLMAYQQHPDF